MTFEVTHREDMDTNDDPVDISGRPLVKKVVRLAPGTVTQLQEYTIKVLHWMMMEHCYEELTVKLRICCRVRGKFGFR